MFDLEKKKKKRRKKEEIFASDVVCSILSHIQAGFGVLPRAVLLAGAAGGLLSAVTPVGATLTCRNDNDLLHGYLRVAERKEGSEEKVSL
jgi:hypothetical protein